MQRSDLLNGSALEVDFIQYSSDYVWKEVRGGNPNMRVVTSLSLLSFRCGPVGQNGAVLLWIAAVHRRFLRNNYKHYLNKAAINHRNPYIHRT